MHLLIKPGVVVAVTGVAVLWCAVMGPVASAAQKDASRAPSRDFRLVTAAQERDASRVRTLLQEGADVNARRPDGATALMWAAHWADVEMARQLLRAGANPNAADEQGVSPLALACETGDEAVVAVLLGGGAKPDQPQVNGVTPLMMAARTGNLKVAQMLIENGADASRAITATGQTALMWATAERHVPMMRQLIAAGANVRAASTIGFTALLFAARNGDLEATTVLLGAGADLNQRGSDGTHALPLAIVSGHDELALFLLEQGADPNGTMYGVGALHAASGSVDLWLRDWLRARGASVDARATSGLEASKRAALVKALLARGANPNARITTSTVMGLGVSGKHGAFDPFSTGTGDLRGATPLWVAAAAANGAGRGSGGAAAVDAMKLLLEAGADPNAATEDGTTVLMAAAGLGRASYQPGAMRGAPSPSAEAAARLLVEAGANVNAVNEAKFTALHAASFRGLNEVVEYLVKHGASINAQDFRNRTPYRLAQSAQQGFRVQAWPETAALLERLGADTSLGVDGRDLERELARQKPAAAGKQ
jgi:ankyrin repeat protein